MAALFCTGAKAQLGIAPGNYDFRKDSFSATLTIIGRDTFSYYEAISPRQVPNSRSPIAFQSAVGTIGRKGKEPVFTPAKAVFWSKPGQCAVDFIDLAGVPGAVAGTVLIHVQSCQHPWRPVVHARATQTRMRRNTVLCDSAGNGALRIKGGPGDSIRVTARGYYPETVYAPATPGELTVYLFQQSDPVDLFRFVVRHSDATSLELVNPVTGEKRLFLKREEDASVTPKAP